MTWIVLKAPLNPNQPTLVDCDHIMQQKVEMGTWQDRSVTQCLGYLHTEAVPDRK